MQIQQEEKKVLEREISDGKTEAKKLQEILQTVEKALESCKSDLAESEQKIKDMVEANKKLQVQSSTEIAEMEIIRLYSKETVHYYNGCRSTTIASKAIIRKCRKSLPV